MKPADTHPTAEHVANLRTAWLDARDMAAKVYVDARNRELWADLLAGADKLVGEAATRFIDAKASLEDA